MIKSVDKSEHGCCDHKTSRNTTCCAEMRKIFVLGRGGAGYLQMGRVRIRKKKEKWGRRVSVEWVYIHFCRRHYRRFYSVGEYVGEPVGDSDGQSTRHRTDLLFKSLGDSVGICNGTPVTSPVRIWHFKSVGDSVGIFAGEQVPSRVRAPSFNSVGKITSQNLGAIYPPFFH